MFSSLPPSLSLRKRKKILQFWLDWDGCADYLIVCNYTTRAISINTGHILFRAMVERIDDAIKAGLDVIVIVSSGSNRQSYRADYSNSYKIRAGQTPHITISSLQGLHAITLALKNKFAHDPRVTVYLDRYLLTDSVSNVSPGTTWEQMIRKIYDPGTSFPNVPDSRTLPREDLLREEKLYNDEFKTMQTYLKAHRAIDMLRDALTDETVVYFFDDKVEILTRLFDVFSVPCDRALPSKNNFQIKLRNYDHERNRITNKGHIRGNGYVNRSWHNLLAAQKQQNSDEDTFIAHISTIPDARHYYSAREAEVAQTQMGLPLVAVPAYPPMFTDATIEKMDGLQEMQPGDNIKLASRQLFPVH